MNRTVIKFGASGGKMTINGKSFNIVGTMSITDEGIFVDGKPVEEYEEPPVFKIEIEGNANIIESENSDIHISGNAGVVTTKNGNVYVGRDVLHNTETKNGNIHVNGNVCGDVTTKNGNISY